jgi:7 transmembrane receptor (rhodopsin family)
MTYYNYKDLGVRKWIILTAIALAVGFMFFLNINQEHLRLLCLWSFLTVASISVLFTLMRLSVKKMVRALICYLNNSKNLICELFVQSKRRHEITADKSTQSTLKINEEEVRLTFTLFLTFASFCFCYAPFTIFFFLPDNLFSSSTMNDAVHIFSLFAIYLNSVLDPIIFCTRVRHVRDGINKMCGVCWCFSCCCCCCRNYVDAS